MITFKPYRLLFIFFLILLSCNAGKTITRPTLEEFQAHPINKVSASELIKNKAKYQGQYIETQGYFHHAFEECAIYYDNKIAYGDSILKFRNYRGIWIDIYHPSLKGEDSLQDKFITVKGYFDTTRKGHLGNYEATIVHTFSMIIADSLQ